MPFSTNSLPTPDEGLSWGWLLARGIFSILFAVALFVWPLAGIVAIGVLLGIYMFFDGVLTIGSAIRSYRKHRRWGALLVAGVISILAGLLIAVWPVAAVIYAALVLAAWALMAGGLEIYAAFTHRTSVRHPILLAVVGLVSVLLGFFFIFVPEAGAATLLALVSIYAFTIGVFSVALSITMKGSGHSGSAAA